MRIKLLHIVVAASAVFVFAVMWWIPKYVPQYAGNWDPAKAGQFGDMFGLANALFSGLAFVGLIITLLLQIEELRSSRNAARRQLQVAAKAARLSALPGLIEAQTDHLSRCYQQQLKAAPPGLMRGFPSATYDWLAELMEGCWSKPALDTAVPDHVDGGHNMNEHFREHMQTLIDYKVDLKTLYSSLRNSGENE
jgi:hypothetical protein